jgi:hypothetical protein
VYISLRNSVFVVISTASQPMAIEVGTEEPLGASSDLAVPAVGSDDDGASHRILETYGAPHHAIKPVDAPLIASAVPAMAARAVIGIPGASTRKSTGDRPAMRPREESENSLRLWKVCASGPV